MEIKEQIQASLNKKPIMVFMKGTPDFPQCGFSMQTVQALKACNAEFGYIDVLSEPEVRAGLPQISNWPTFPQVFVNGELIGGCDIVLSLFQSGELQALIDKAGP